MRDVILYMSMSLDGFVASDRGHPGIAIPEGAELKQWKLDRVSKAGAHLMGRVTYQEMSSYWPQSDDPYAAPMNDIPKVVFSKTLSDAEATWPETRVARGDLATEIAAIKAEPGPDVIVWGGSRLAGASSGDLLVVPRVEAPVLSMPDGWEAAYTAKCGSKKRNLGRWRKSKARLMAGRVWLL